MYVPMFVFWFVLVIIGVTAYPQQALWLAGAYLWLVLCRGR